MHNDSTTRQKRLLQQLQREQIFAHPVTSFQLIETHISWVLLTGPYAYKIKKAVDFGFLDYSTLAKRKFQCEEELRLNRRTAPELYLEVVAIGGTLEQPQLNREPAIEYMVKMHQFPQQALLTQMLARSALTESHIKALAQTIADFHAAVVTATPDSPYGTVEAISHPIYENFAQIRERISSDELLKHLQTIEASDTAFIQKERKLFEQRKRDGFIRDCHGDLHLNNILLLDDTPQLFDCIEFNPQLRIIDVMSEVAFLVMDLQEHERSDLANLLLNSYLQQTGDYAGIRLLRFYLRYRAMVRAKVVTIRLGQAGITSQEEQEIHHAFSAYLKLAENFGSSAQPHIFITHGLSGSGKTTLTSKLMQRLGAIRIRSDVERKRLFAKKGNEPGDNSNIYTDDASRLTYQRLAELTTAITKGGYPVIVDATFLEQSERERFRALAKELGLAFTILHFDAAPEVLSARIQNRIKMGNDVSDADLKVLQNQLRNYEPLTKDEIAETVVIDTEAEQPLDAIEARL